MDRWTEDGPLTYRNLHFGQRVFMLDPADGVWWEAESTFVSFAMIQRRRCKAGEISFERFNLRAIPNHLLCTTEKINDPAVTVLVGWS